MTPWYSMSGDGDAAMRAAVLSDLKQTLQALDCAVKLLDRGPAAARERAIAAAIHRAIRRAESALSRLPSRKSP